MIEKKTVIDQIEVARSGYIHVRFALMLLEDGREAASSQWHRTAIEPGGDVDAQLAVVDAHLRKMGKAAIDSGRIAELKSIVAVVHTPDVVEAFRDGNTARET